MLRLDKIDIYWKRVTSLWYIPCLLSLALITVINVSSIIGYFYFLLLSVVLYFLIFKSLNREILFLYSTYALLSIVLYLLQYWTLPEFFGFSGGTGIGTDDCRYFQQVAVGWNFLPKHCFQEITLNHPFSQLLSFITPYKVYHLFDVLFFNCIGAALTPLFTREVTSYIKNDRRVVWATFLFTAICPFLLSNSLILLRDGWTATLLIGAVYFLYRKKFLLMAGTVILLFYIRIASGGVALGILGVLGWVMYSESHVHKYLRPVLLVAFFGIVAIIAVYTAPIILEYMVNKGIATEFFREAYFEERFARGETNPLFLQLMSQPAIIRIPISTAFYTVMPLFSPGNIISNGIFVPRSFMSSILYASLFVFYFHFLIRGFLYSLKNSDNKILIIFGLYIFLLVLLSQLSLQPRHKTIIMPLMYILVGYGCTYFGYYENRIAAILTSIFVMAQTMLLFL